MFRPDIHLLAETARFRRYGQCAASMTSIFSGMKQGGYLYRFIGRYSTELIFLIQIWIE